MVLAVLMMVERLATPLSIGGSEMIGLHTAPHVIVPALAVTFLGPPGAVIRTGLGPRVSANLAGIALSAAPVIAAVVLTPAVDEVPERLSAILLWRFRRTSFGPQAAIWSTIGVGFGALEPVRLSLKRSFNISL